MADISLNYKNFPKMPRKVTSFFKKAEIEKFFKQKALEVLAHSEKNLDSGRDVDGGPMKRYSASYRKTLIAAGESTKTDLLRTGELRNSRIIRGVPLGARIEFTPGRSGKKPSNKLKVDQRNSRRLNRAGRNLSRANRGTGRSGRGGGRVGGGGTITNTKLAEELMDRGFDNWHAISKKDRERINKEFGELAQKKFIEHLKRNAINSD